jgi:hypothetical protein
MAYRPRQETCGFKNCTDLHAEGSYVCATHGEVLRPIKEAMEAEEDPYNTRGVRRTRQVPQCTRPGCRNPRRSGESMCADCSEEAFWDGSED